MKQCILKQDVNSAAWLIGNDIIIPAPTRRAIRDMKNPGIAYKNDPELKGTDPQPDHFSRNYTGMQNNEGVHINSGIPIKLFVKRLWHRKMILGKAGKDMVRSYAPTPQTVTLKGL